MSKHIFKLNGGYHSFLCVFFFAMPHCLGSAELSNKIVSVTWFIDWTPGGTVLPEDLGGGVRHASRNHYPISDQNM